MNDEELKLEAKYAVASLLLDLLAMVALMVLL